MNIKFISISFCFLLFSFYALAQTGNIKGTVTTSDGKPAELVNIVLKQTTRGAVVNVKGNYSVNKIPAGNYTVEASFKGLETQSKNITVAANQTVTVDFILEENHEQLQEVIVRASVNKVTDKTTDYVARMPIKNLENSQSYAVISKEIMKEQLAVDIESALKNAPGVSAVAGGPGGGGYSVGFTSRGFNNSYTSIRNGLTAGSVTLVDPVNVERLEVIKGPSSTLFGSSVISYGGLINIVTKQPFSDFKGEVAYTTGSFGFNRLTADINSPLNQDKSVMFRVNIAGEFGKGFQDYGTRKLYDVAPSLLYNVNDRLTLRLDAEFFATNRPIILYAPWGGAGASNFSELNLDIKKSYLNEGFNATQKTTNIFARADYKLSNSWTSQTNFSSTSGNNQTPYLFLNIEQKQNGDRYVVREIYDVVGSLNTVNFQQNFIGDFKIGNVRNRLLVGLDYTNFNGASTRRDLYHPDTLDVNYDNYTPLNKDNVSQLLAGVSSRRYPYAENIYSAYVSDVVNITDRFLAMASVRIDNYNDKDDELPSQTAISPKFGLVYQVVKDKVSLFANYMNGFRNTFETDANGKLFKPEYANQLEGGAKFELLEHKLNSTLSYYYIKVRDIIRPDPTNPDFSIQDGTLFSKGFDFDLTAQPVAGLTLVAGYGYNDNKYEKASAAIEGKRALATPVHTANFWASYAINDGALNGLGIGVGANGASQTYILNDDNSFVLDGYAVCDASLFYNQPKWRIGLKLNNVGNKHYWIANYYPVPQAPRQLLASLVYRF